VAHIGELVGGFDARIHVDAAVAGRLGVGAQAGLGHDLTQREGRLDGVGEAASGLRVEVDAELVRIVEVRRPHRPGMERDRAHLGGPGERGRLVEDELIVAPAAGIGAGHPAQERGRARRRALGEELLALDALREALQRHRPVAVQCQERTRDREQVVGEVALGHGRGPRGRGPEHLPGAAQLDRAQPVFPRRLDDLCLAHAR